jgi:alkyldihydroxyacetonephosphate synthase
MSTTNPENPPGHTQAHDDLGPGVPTAPIALGGAVANGGAATARWGVSPVTIPDDVLEHLRTAVDGRVTTEATALAEASRDWWPLAMTWAADGTVAAVAGAVVQPGSTADVSAVLAICNSAGIPVTAAGGRSGVCGASVPLFGGVVLDMCAMTGIVSVDTDSMVVDVAPGTFGDHFEHELSSTWGVTVGHWPQSMSLSTVGGWLACRGAGQLSNRYGKIEDMVIGLDVVLADGTVVHTGGNARQASGPDLNQLFVGSEGTLGVITGARLRLHRLPAHRAISAWGFASFADGLDACRRIVHRGASPAVLRLYDDIEANRSYSTGSHHVLLVLDEGDELLTTATMAIVDAECAGAERLDDGLVDQWMGHRNDVSALESLISRGFVVDTMEVTAPWARLDHAYQSITGAIAAVDGTLVASAHQSHAYSDGACLYVTFAGRVDATGRDAYYRAAWDAGTLAALELGGSLSHHHGIGINRARFMRQALGSGFDVLASLKTSLDPNGILNPGKLGLGSPFGVAPFATPGP